MDMPAILFYVQDKALRVGHLHHGPWATIFAQLPGLYLLG